MTEFLLGYLSGIGSSIMAAVLISEVVVGYRVERGQKPESDDQPDIYLTKIKSTYVRNVTHD